MLSLNCLFIAILAVFGTADAIDGPIVLLPKGKIRGHILQSEAGKPFYAFQEIPYAAPPVGKNRFQLPKEPESWSGILNTTQNTVVCYQQASEVKDLINSEDCLYLNVYTPVQPGTSKRLPVLFWIHGGRFSRHSGVLQAVGPKYVIDHDVVVVSINYRLGTLGFLTTDDDVIPANIQMEDQYFALEWVQNNIELFGGNKSQVTVAGESSGAMCISAHLPGPWKDGKVLYHGAILQSGSSMFYTKSNRAREQAFQLGRALDKNFSSTSSKDLLEVLQKASAEEILNAGVGGGFPIVAKNGKFSYQTYESIKTGNFKKIPILMGFNSEEWISDASNPNLKQTAASYDNDPSKLISSAFNISSVNRAVYGNLMRKIYTNTTFQENLGAYVRWDSDNHMSTGITTEAELLSKYTDVHLYQFSYAGKIGSERRVYLPGCESVGHAEDLSYLWESGRNSDLSKFPAADGLMLHRFVKLWTNFVKYHNPTPEKDEFLQNQIWLKVNPNEPEKIPYFNMNATLEVRENPRYYQKVRNIVNLLLPYIN